MKRFWIVLAVVLGFLAFLSMVGLGVYIVKESIGEVRSGGSGPDGPIVIWMDLSQGVPETVSNDPFQRFVSRDIPTLLDIDRALTCGAEDDDVTGLVIDLSQISAGIAQLEEIRNAVLRFRASGKWAIAYADTFFTGGTGTGVYYLASACDEIYMHRTGDVGFSGIAIQPLFFADALNRLGIKPAMGQRHEYKTMTNMFTESGYTEPHREIEQRMIDQIMDHILDGVASARELDRTHLAGLVDRAPFIGSEAIEADLIDGFKYWDEVKDRMDELAGTSIGLLSLPEYLDQSVPDLDQSGEHVIALVYGVGEIVRGDAETGMRGNSVIASRALARAIRQIREDPDVDAVVFRVSSPGGSYDASDTIAHEIILTRDSGIPVVVSMGDVAASGGYYVSMYADVIFAQPTTITGSIGVAGGKFVVTELLNRFGITTDEIHSGDHSMLLSFFRDASPSEQERLDAMLDRIYADFTGEVMRSRGLTPEAIDTVARGRVWAGADALDHGLIDHLGGLHESILAARELAEIEPQDAMTIRLYPREKSLWELLTQPDSDLVTEIRIGVGRMVDTFRVVSALTEHDFVRGVLSRSLDSVPGALRAPIDADSLNAGVSRGAP
ncbi:signal peptide peptidase SppA [bacterium]|nr:signal peptide peptidase SppA [candidate division CSSED10-310 bacterium]